ncbi:telomere repeat-binding protein 2 [Canna indica]|uniref:Telomere repeat-binding protein 2 n=1 Tax=Canna indica TaxID=4628 RepID=A0AAQ3QGH6_9LILI|nr:telomere repeat-binding protein 2 [Canna indica]
MSVLDTGQQKKSHSYARGSPHIPKGKRSVTQKRQIVKKLEKNRLSAFDMLVTAAAAVLEMEKSQTRCNTTGKYIPIASMDTVKQEQKNKEKLFELEGFHKLSSSDFEDDDAFEKPKVSRTSHFPPPFEKSISYMNAKCSKGKLHSYMESHEFKHDEIKTELQAELMPGYEIKDFIGYCGNVAGPSYRRKDDIFFSADKDDEKFSICTHPTTLDSNESCRLHDVGDCRIRKHLTSKFQKVSQSKLKDDEKQKAPLPLKRFYNTWDKTEGSSSVKKRKLSDGCSIEAGAVGIKLETNDSISSLSGANDSTSSAITGDKAGFESSDNPVKLIIKPCEMPELVIEVTETATVGSLKRRIVEALIDILESGLNVNVILQGKMVGDDDKTLLEAGISHGARLMFRLEANPKEAQEHLPGSEDPHFLSLGRSSEDIPRITSTITPGATQSIEACHENGYDTGQFPVNASSSENKVSNLLSLVVTSKTDGLVMVNSQQHKPKGIEATRRRVRRPFSVSEVEALVLAVEKLGTGRWRDVKLHAFEHAKHRTYVDLKDKWKTLVHTAKISPQQRRGEPVPQELLDRVLLAHAYWSRQQANSQSLA